MTSNVGFGHYLRHRVDKLEPCMLCGAHRFARVMRIVATPTGKRRVCRRCPEATITKAAS